jgi:hypothetical protein
MQENNIISIFKNAMLKNAIDASFYVDAPEAWNEVWLQLQYQAVSAHRTSLLFSQTYLVDSGHKVYDLSLILCSDGRPVGLLPLSLEQIGQRWKFGSMGGRSDCSNVRSLIVSADNQKTLCTHLECLATVSLRLVIRPIVH